MKRQVAIALATLIVWPLVVAGEDRECLVAWHATGGPVAMVDCRDGDPGCDDDGQADGQCTVHARLCLLGDGCAGQVLTGVSVRGRSAGTVAAQVAAMTLPLAASHCTPAAAIITRASRASTLRVTAETATERDRDRLRVRCRRATRGGSAVVVTTDFETGGLTTVAVAAPHRARVRDEVVHEDAIVRTSADWVFVVNRHLGDNVQVLDPHHGLRERLRCPTGVTSNPHDVASVRADKAYVTRYGEKQLWVVDPSARTCAGFKIGSIGLGDLADADGIPEMSQMAIVGDRLFVSVQRLDRDRGFAPADTSRLAVIDTATDVLVGQMRLVGRNAFGDASGIQREPGSGKLLLAMAGNVYATGDGGIERVDPTTGSEGFVVSEAELGGSPTDFVMISATRLYALVITEALANLLVAFDLDTRKATRVLRRDAYLPDIALGPDGLLWLADLGAEINGLRLFDPATNAEVTSVPIRTGLPPFSIGFLP